MAADINTQLQNITTDVTAISNLVNRLVTIFSGGGVQNPDLATMKAELQGWVTGQLSSYITTTSATSSFAAKSYSLDADSYVDVYPTYANDNIINGNKARVGLIRISNGTGKNTILLGVCDESNNPPVGLNVVNENGFVYSYIQGKFTSYSDLVCNGIFNISRDTPVCVLSHKTYIKGGKPSENKNCFINFSGSVNDGSNDLAKIINMVDTTGDNYLIFRVMQTQSTNSADLSIKYKWDGAILFYTPGQLISQGPVRPATDNDQSCGLSNARWSQVYAGNGTIQTSDKRLKTEIESIPDAVMRAWGKVNFKKFKFVDSVEKKGATARIHIGLIANDLVDSVAQAFASEGLDARQYGLFCWDSWENEYEDKQVLIEPEVTTKVKVVDSPAIYKTEVAADGTVKEVLVSEEVSHMENKVVVPAKYKTEQVLVRTAGDRYSLRYEQCLCLEAAYQRWVLKKIADKVGVVM